MSSYAYNLDKLKRFELIEGQQSAINDNYFKNFKELGTQVKKVIHGFPKSFQNSEFTIADMELYLGVALTDQLYSRFSSHKKEKKHTFGIIIGCCESNIANYLEKAGITLLKKLQRKNTLCIRNYVARGHDYSKNKNVTDSELIFFYLTIKFNPHKDNTWNKPNKEIREEIKSEVLESLIDEQLDRTDKSHITTVIETIHKESDYDRVFWCKSHR